MTKKDILRLAEMQGDLIVQADRCFNDLKYFFEENHSAEERKLLRIQPFETMSFSLERTLILLYSYLLSDNTNDPFRLSSLLNQLANSKRNLTSWDIGIEEQDLIRYQEKLNQIRSNSKIINVRNDMVGHLSNSRKQFLDFDSLSMINDFLLEIEREVLAEIVKTSKRRDTIFSLSNHVKRHLELLDFEQRYWSEKEK